MRIENSLKLAKKQQEKEDLLLRLLGQSVSVLENTNRLIVKLSGDLYPTQPFNPSDRNNNCECNGNNESEHII